MQPRHALLDELLHLPRGKLDPNAKLVLGAARRSRKSCLKFARKPSAAQRRDPLDLGQVRDRQDARHHGHPNADLLAAIAKSPEVFVVVEQLRDDSIGAGIDLAPQVLEIGLGAGRFAVRFRIARHGDAEAGELACESSDTNSLA